jgi:hypothetical protein
MVRMLVADDAAKLVGPVVLQRGLARRLATPTTQPSRDSVPNCRVGITRSGRSKAPVMISIRGPSMRRKLSGVPQSAQKSRSAIEEERNAAGLPRVQAKSPVNVGKRRKRRAGGLLAHPAMTDADFDRQRRHRKADGAALAAAGQKGLSPRSCSHPSAVGLCRTVQRIAAGKDKIANTGGPKRGFLLAGAACQIDMLCAGGLKGLCRGCRLPA